MANKPEGLFYCISQWVRSSLGPGATQEQIIEEFLRFTEFGARDQHGNYLQALDGSGQMNGTLNWLAGYGIFKANFYLARKPEPLVFVSLPNASNPWSKNPGFMEFVKVQEADLSKDALSLEARKELDQALAAMQHPIESLPADDRKDLQEALKGEKRNDLLDVVDRLRGHADSPLRDFFEDRFAASRSAVAAGSTTGQKA